MFSRIFMRENAQAKRQQLFVKKGAALFDEQRRCIAASFPYAFYRSKTLLCGRISGIIK